MYELLAGFPEIHSGISSKVQIHQFGAALYILIEWIYSYMIEWIYSDPPDTDPVTYEMLTGHIWTELDRGH